MPVRNLQKRRGPWNPAVLLLTVTILAIAWSPRIRLGALGDRSVDLRIQDLILLVSLAVLGFSPRARHFRKMRYVWGEWLVLFAFYATSLTVLLLLLDGSSVLVRGAYLGRAIEAFLLAAVICGLYFQAGSKARGTALRALHLAIVGNALWVLFQVATGVNATLVGDGENTVVFYGPQLIGEPSAFGTGAFFLFTAALGAGEFRAGLASRKWALGLVAIGLVGTLLSGSRINIGATILIVVALLLRSANHKARHPFRLIGALGLGMLVLATAQFTLAERLTTSGLERGLDTRINEIWAPIFIIISDNWFLGIGPGALDITQYPWPEAHSIYLRAILDYGLIGALLFFSIFVSIFRTARRASRLDDVAPHLTAYATATYMLIAGFALAGIVQETFTVVASTHLMMLITGLFAGEYVVHERLSGSPPPGRESERSRELRAWG